MRMRQANDRNDNVAAIKNESIASIDLVKYSGSERYEIGRYSSQFTYNQRADLEYRTFYRMVTLTQELILDTGKRELHASAVSSCAMQADLSGATQAYSSVHSSWLGRSPLARSALALSSPSRATPRACST